MPKRQSENVFLKKQSGVLYSKTIKNIQIMMHILIIMIVMGIIMI